MINKNTVNEQPYFLILYRFSIFIFSNMYIYTKHLDECEYDESWQSEGVKTAGPTCFVSTDLD